MGKRFILTLFLCLTFSFPAFAAGAPDTFGLSTRAIALGGAFCGLADNYAATYYNPAGLAVQTGNTITFDYFYAKPDIEVKTMTGLDLKTYSVSGNVQNNPTDYRGGSSDGLDFQAPVIGATFDVNGMVNVSPNIQMGLILSPGEQADTLYRIHSFPPDQPHFIRYADNISRIHIILGLGFEVIPDLLYVGGGAQSMLYGDGLIFIDRLGLATTPQQAYVIGQVSQTSLMKNNFMAGVMLTLFDKSLKIGLSAKDDMLLELDPMPTIIQTDPSMAGGAAVLSMIMGMQAFYCPEEFSLGISYEHEKFLVTAEATVQKWSKYRYSFVDRIYYRPDNANAVGADLQGIETGQPDFDDTVNLKLGFEYKINDDISVMLGYGFQPTPVPEQSYRVSNYLDMDKHLVSLGGSYSFGLPFLGMDKPLKIEGAVQYQMLDDYTVIKNGVQGKSWGNQESYKVEGDVLSGGLAVTVAW